MANALQMARHLAAAVMWHIEERRIDHADRCRPLEPIGNTPPAEAEERYHAMINGAAIAA
jgi:hypothetical protein